MSNTITVWGVGYIGMTTLRSLAQAGHKCIAVDINKNVIDSIKKVKNHLPLLTEYYDNSYVEAITDIEIDAYTPDDFMNMNFNVDVHFVCVPTEANGLPLMDIATNTIEKISDYELKQSNNKIIIIIESTLTPGTGKILHNILLKKLSRKHLHFVVAPRRDWFEKEYNTDSIIRIYGADTDAAADCAEPLLRITTPILKRASHYTISEIVKPVENAFRHLDIMLAQQLSLSYGDIDIREVLELAGTKWNVNTYFPSIGVGGYCIPISSKYILEGNKSENHLSLLQNVVDFEKEFINILCDFLRSEGIKKIGILGASYRNNIIILNGSPLIQIIKKLHEMGIEVYLSDPSFKSSELNAFFDVKIYNVQKIETYMFDGIIINNWHKNFNVIINDEILEHLFKCKLVLDNTGELEYYANSNLLKNYHLIGRSSWRKTILE
ncbi:MAG: UDP binding domain-containing protein [Saccharofermentanales bacterium]